MESSNLKLLINEYSRKKDAKIAEARLKKEKIYKQHPKLQEIDSALSKHAISTAKSILSSNDQTLIDELNKKIVQLKKEKEQIYKELNIDENYFLPDFDCKLCNDTGYVSKGYSSEMCQCLKQKLFDIEYNTYNVYNMKNNTFNKFELSYYSDEINREKYNSNISPRENMSQIYNICTNFIKNFDNPTEKNLLFTGNTGLGKTFLSTCIANELINSGKTVLYQTAPVMIDTIINYRLRKSKK